MACERILIADPEPKSVHLLREIFTTAGYKVLATKNGERAVQLLVEEQPALMITDNCLQDGLSAVELLHRIRSFSDIPILILSENGESSSILAGYEAGADDYITKPFDAKVLLARVNAILQRCRGQVPSNTEIIIHDIVLNLPARQVSVGGNPIYLTETEYNLLFELVKHRNKVLSHEQLLSAVWGPKFRTELDYLRSYIHMLRRKLEKTPSQPQLIVSRPGIGYMLVSSPKMDVNKT